MPASQRIAMCYASPLSYLFIAIVVTVSWQTPAGFSQTPAVPGHPGAASIFVLDDSDGTYQGKDRYEDNLTFFNASGATRFRVSGLNGCQAVGSHHLIAADAQRQCVWVSEIVVGCIKRFDLNGKETLTIPLKGAGAIALHPETGNLWALVSDGTIYGTKTVVLDEEGQEIITHAEVTGSDIVYDRTENAFWTVGKNVTKVFATDGLVDFSHRVAEWCAVSVDMDPQSGAAWIGVRRHPQVPGSKNQLVKFSRHGKLLATVELGEKGPFSVSVDPHNGDVWMANFKKSVERFSADGKHLGSHPIQALAVLARGAGKEAEGVVWAVTGTELMKVDAQGKVLLRIELAGKTGQAWLGVLE